MTTTIEVTAIRPPKEGRKNATVVDSNGKSYLMAKAAADKLSIDRRYEVEIENFEFNGRPFREIKKAKEVMQAGHATTPNPDMRPQPSATVGANEQAFVATLLNGALIGGHLKFEAADLARGARLAQMLYSQSFGASVLANFKGTQQ